MLKKPKNLPKSCKWNRYKGRYKPRCSGGKGCQKCWKIYHEKRTHTGVTDITVILDRSGSMGTIRRPMEDGLRELVNSQKNTKETCYFTLVKFDDRYEMVIDKQPIQEVSEFDLKLVPRGMTALRDAIGRTVNDKRRNVGPSSDKILFYIITDGLENASREYSESQIRRMIEECEQKGWQFTYLGEGGQKVGADLGFKRNKAATYTYNDVGTRGLFRTVSTKLCSVISADSDADLECLVAITEEDLARMNQ